MKRLFIVVSLFLTIISCKKDRIEIDSTSAQTFSETVDKMSKTLPLLQQDKFKEALDIVFEYKTSNTMDNEARWATVRTLLSGKSVDQVFELAEQISLENNFTWNRNQVPLVNGIPKKEEKSTENSIIEEPTNSIQRFDFSLKQDESGFSISPFFYNGKGEEVQLQGAITVTIEVFNSGNIIYSSRSRIEPSSMDDLYRKNTINLKYSSLDKSKIKNNRLDILIRVPSTERYLTNRKAVQIPDSFIGGNSVSDSLTLENNREQVSVGKETEMLKSLSNRFVLNLTKKNYSGAFALTRNEEWSTFQKFSSDENLKKLEQATIRDINILDADEKVAVIQINTTLKDKVEKSYQLKLEKINNKWFVINFK